MKGTRDRSRFGMDFDLQCAELDLLGNDVRYSGGELHAVAQLGKDLDVERGFRLSRQKRRGVGNHLRDLIEAFGLGMESLHLRHFRGPSPVGTGGFGVDGHLRMISTFGGLHVLPLHSVTMRASRFINARRFIII